MAYKVLDIFSGAGGMSHGVAKAGFKILQAVDVDADALASLKMNHPNTIIERKAVSWLGLHAPAAFDWIGFGNTRMRRFSGDRAGCAHAHHAERGNQYGF